MEIHLGTRLEISLSPEQRLRIRLNLRLALLETLSNDRYRAKATCPACNRRLTSMEILKGFRRDPRDYTTRCPRCGHRFNAQLILTTPSGQIELQLFCAEQTLNQLLGKDCFKPIEFMKVFPSVYRSVLFHFGSLKAAFTKLKVNYRYSEKHLQWQNKVRRFLGRLPDAVIASAVGVSTSSVRKLRIKLDIAPSRDND